MTHASDVDGVVAADGAGLRGERVGGAEHGAALLDDVLALPDHGDDRAAGHVLDEPGFADQRRARDGERTEEGLRAQVRVVLLEVLDRGVDHLERRELEAALLEAERGSAIEVANSIVAQASEARATAARPSRLRAASPDEGTQVHSAARQIAQANAPSDDLADEAALDAIGLNHDEALLGRHFGESASG